MITRTPRAARVAACTIVAGVVLGLVLMAHGEFPRAFAVLALCAVACALVRAGLNSGRRPPHVVPATRPAGRPADRDPQAPAPTATLQLLTVRAAGPSGTSLPRAGGAS